MHAIIPAVDDYHGGVYSKGHLYQIRRDMARSKYITLSEGEKISGLSPSTLRVLARTGRVKARKTHRDVWLIREEDLRAYLRSPRKPGPPRGPRKKKEAEDG
jgi:hypothetical protein